MPFMLKASLLNHLMGNLENFKNQADFKNRSYHGQFIIPIYLQLLLYAIIVAYQAIRLLIVVKRNAIKKIHGHIQIISVKMGLFICLVQIPQVLLLHLYGTWTLALVNI